MAKAPAFQLYAADFLTDTADWSNVEIGIYMRLLCHQWINGSIPKAQDRACRVAHSDPIEFGIAWKVVGAKFIDAAEEGKLINQKLESVRKTRQEYVDKQVEFGKQGAKQRWGGKVAYKVAHKTPTRVEMPLQSSSSSSTVKQDQELTPLPPLKSPNSPPFDSEAAIERIYFHYPKPMEAPRTKASIAHALASLSAEMGGDEEAVVFLETMTQKYRLQMLPFKNIPELWDQVPKPWKWFGEEKYNDDPATWMPVGAQDGKGRDERESRNGNSVRAKQNRSFDAIGAALKRKLGEREPDPGGDEVAVPEPRDHGRGSGVVIDAVGAAVPGVRPAQGTDGDAPHPRDEQVLSQRGRGAGGD